MLGISRIFGTRHMASLAGDWVLVQKTKGHYLHSALLHSAFIWMVPFWTAPLSGFCFENQLPDVLLFCQQLFNQCCGFQMRVRT